MTHQAPANWWSLFSGMVSVVARNLFSEHQVSVAAHFDFRTDGRTDTLRENNDQPIRPWPWWVNKHLLTPIHSSFPYIGYYGTWHM